MRDANARHVPAANTSHTTCARRPPPASASVPIAPVPGAEIRSGEPKRPARSLRAAPCTDPDAPPPRLQTATNVPTEIDASRGSESRSARSEATVAADDQRPLGWREAKALRPPRPVGPSAAHTATTPAA